MTEHRFCSECREPLPADAGRGRKRIYCSNRCKLAARRRSQYGVSLPAISAKNRAHPRTPPRQLEAILPDLGLAVGDLRRLAVKSGPGLAVYLEELSQAIADAVADFVSSVGR